MLSFHLITTFVDVRVVLAVYFGDCHYDAISKCSDRDITVSLITERPPTYLMRGSDYFHILLVADRSTLDILHIYVKNYIEIEQMKKT